MFLPLYKCGIQIYKFKIKMLLFLSELHKEHLLLLKSQPVQVLINFCKLAIDYLNNGINTEKYTIFADKLNIDQLSVHNIVQAIVYLLSEGYKHNLSTTEFKASLSLVEFPLEAQEVLTKLYTTKQEQTSEILFKLQKREPSLQDFTWRFETQVASRECSTEIKPQVTMDFVLQTPKSTQDMDLQLNVNNSIENAKTASECQNVISHVLLQTDLPNLVNLTNKLEQALKESKSQHVRKVQRALQR